MKIVKYSMVAMVLAVVVNFVNVAADVVRDAPASGIVAVAFDTIKPGGSYSTYKFNRTGDSMIRQSYGYGYAQTTITSPCPNCKFRSSLYCETGIVGYTIGKTNDNKYFPEKSRVDGEYQVVITREDWTAVNSYHIGSWYLKANNPNI